ncbi:unnamed protein product, partial [Brenthis ino]
MKLNISMMQLVIRLLILMILIVMLGIISTFLYSVKFWPDIYNYINANITIKRIPKISEIENLTIIEDTMSMTTDFYESTDFSTTEAYEDDYSKFEDFEDLNRRRRNVKVDEGKDYSEIPKSNVVVDYVFDSGENVDINDSIDESLICVIVLIKGIVGNSECDTYIKCVGSFFDIFFGVPDVININDTDSDIAVPGFENINVASINLHNILESVSSFLKEEVTNGFQFGNPINALRNASSDTTIYVKIIPINVDVENIKEDSDIVSEINSTDTYFQPNTKTEIVLPKQNKINKNNTQQRKNINKTKKKIQENEIPNTEFAMYYDTDDNSTDYPIIDYIELYKDTTNEYVEIKIETSTMSHLMSKNETYVNTSDNSIYIEENCTANTNISQLIFPWVATIFIKNDTSDQFDYYCDGAVVSKNVIITAARCLQYYETWTKSENIIVLLDKTSLRSMNGNEMAVKVKEVIIHDNFTMRPENDIAILVMETSLKRQTACFGEGDFGEAFTTGWAVSGELTLIPFDTEGIVNCNDFPVNNTFCASYKNDVSVCPSYGGLFVVRHTNTWYLRGIRSADPTDKGFCVDHDITFTDLTLYLDWIMQYIE